MEDFPKEIIYIRSLDSCLDKSKKYSFVCMTKRDDSSKLSGKVIPIFLDFELKVGQYIIFEEFRECRQVEEIYPADNNGRGHWVYIGCRNFFKEGWSRVTSICMKEVVF